MALEQIISDREQIFTGDAFDELVKNYGIKSCSGAVEIHGSIAVTERVIKTLKYERLTRVTIIKGYDHIEKLYNTSVELYNECRPHHRLDGNTHEDVFAKRQTETLDQNAKTFSLFIEE